MLLYKKLIQRLKYVTGSEPRNIRYDNNFLRAKLARHLRCAALGRHIMEKCTSGLKMYEVAKIIEVAPIEVSATVGESYKFRIEILRECITDGPYHACVYRWETYRLQPTFPLSDGEPENASWDHEILVVDETQDWEHCTGPSVDEVLAQVTQRIYAIFNMTP